MAEITGSSSGSGAPNGSAVVGRRCGGGYVIDSVLVAQADERRKIKVRKAREERHRRELLALEHGKDEMLRIQQSQSPEEAIAAAASGGGGGSGSDALVSNSSMGSASPRKGGAKGSGGGGSASPFVAFASQSSMMNGDASQRHAPPGQPDLEREVVKKIGIVAGASRRGVDDDPRESQKKRDADYINEKHRRKVCQEFGMPAEWATAQTPALKARINDHLRDSALVHGWEKVLTPDSLDELSRLDLVCLHDPQVKHIVSAAHDEDSLAADGSFDGAPKAGESRAAALIRRRSSLTREAMRQSKDETTTASAKKQEDRLPQKKSSSSLGRRASVVPDDVPTSVEALISYPELIDPAMPPLDVNFTRIVLSVLSHASLSADPSNFPHSTSLNKNLFALLTLGSADVTDELTKDTVANSSRFSGAPGVGPADQQSSAHGIRLIQHLFWFAYSAFFCPEALPAQQQGFPHVAECLTEIAEAMISWKVKRRHNTSVGRNEFGNDGSTNSSSLPGAAPPRAVPQEVASTGTSFFDFFPVVVVHAVCLSFVVAFPASQVLLTPNFFNRLSALLMLILTGHETTSLLWEHIREKHFAHESISLEEVSNEAKRIVQRQNELVEKQAKKQAARRSTSPGARSSRTSLGGSGGRARSPGSVSQRRQSRLVSAVNATIMAHRTSRAGSVSPSAAGGGSDASRRKSRVGGATSNAQRSGVAVSFDNSSIALEGPSPMGSAGSRNDEQMYSTGTENLYSNFMRRMQQHSNSSLVGGAGEAGSKQGQGMENTTTATTATENDDMFNVFNRPLLDVQEARRVVKERREQEKLTKQLQKGSGEHGPPLYRYQTADVYHVQYHARHAAAELYPSHSANDVKLDTFLEESGPNRAQRRSNDVSRLLRVNSPSAMLSRREDAVGSTNSLLVSSAGDASSGGAVSSKRQSAPILTTGEAACVPEAELMARNFRRLVASEVRQNNLREQLHHQLPSAIKEKMSSKTEDTVATGDVFGETAVSLNATSSAGAQLQLNASTASSAVALPPGDETLRNFEKARALSPLHQRSRPTTVYDALHLTRDFREDNVVDFTAFGDTRRMIQSRQQQRRSRTSTPAGTMNRRKTHDGDLQKSTMSMNRSGSQLATSTMTVVTRTRNTSVAKTNTGGPLKSTDDEQSPLSAKPSSPFGLEQSVSQPFSSPTSDEDGGLRRTFLSEEEEEGPSTAFGDIIFDASAIEKLKKNLSQQMETVSDHAEFSSASFAYPAPQNIKKQMYARDTEVVNAAAELVVDIGARPATTVLGATDSGGVVGGSPALPSLQILQQQQQQQNRVTSSHSGLKPQPGQLRPHSRATTTPTVAGAGGRTRGEVASSPYCGSSRASSVCDSIVVGPSAMLTQRVNLSGFSPAVATYLPHRAKRMPTRQHWMSMTKAVSDAKRRIDEVDQIDASLEARETVINTRRMEERAHTHHELKAKTTQLQKEKQAIETLMEDPLRRSEAVNQWIKDAPPTTAPDPHSNREALRGALLAQNAKKTADQVRNSIRKLETSFAKRKKVRQGA